MYEVFYGLKEKPFSLLPDPSYLYLSDKHQMAFSLLEYSLLNQAGFCVISGMTGAGKTTLIRHLLNQFGNNVAVGLITNTHQSFGELLRWILMAFEQDHSSDSKPQLYQTFVNFLIEQYAKGRNTVLIVDEAQNMSIETLEELRMLSNINADKDQVLQIILVGQPGLRDKLHRPELEQFAQRIAVDYHLEPLNLEEVDNYIRHRIQVAGGNPELFEAETAETVYRYSGGIPRLINLLCESALVYGYAEGVPRISARLVEDVARERQAHGLLPRMQPEAETVPPADPAAAVGEKKQPSSHALDVSQAMPPGRAGHADTPVMDAVRQVAEAQQLEQRAELDREEVLMQGSASGERRQGVISKLIHLDAWPRSAAGTDSGPVSRHVTRTEVAPQTANVTAGHPTKSSLPPAADHSDTESTGETTKTSSGPAQPAQPEDRDLTTESNRERDMLNVSDNSKKRGAGMGAGGKWVVGAALGFSGGLLIAVILLISAYFKVAGAPSLQPAVSVPAPAVAASSAVPAASGNSAPAGQTMMEALQRERDAAVAQARALERERDAALAAAKARELTSAAELGAAKAREREKAATLEVIRAQDRARTAELDAIVARERERAAALATANAQAQARKPQVENKPPMTTTVPTDTAGTAPAVKAAEVEVRPEPKPESLPVAHEPPAKPAAGDNPVKFSANPCKGPSAKFLSTCKE